MTVDKRQSNKAKGPTRFWIIGAGRFGQLAIDRISRRFAGASITVVDRQPVSLAHAGITTIRQDGIKWLTTMLHANAPVDMIVPAIPVHVAAEWLVDKLKKKYEIRPINIPEYWLVQMPNAFRGKVGQAYVSHADFRCPDNCPEPEKRCTHTGKPRPVDLFRLLATLDFEKALPIVLRSYQLLPGVGGMYPRDLIDACRIACNNNQRPLMIATACRCHGVMDFIRLEEKGPAAERFS